MFNNDELFLYLEFSRRLNSSRRLKEILNYQMKDFDGEIHYGTTN